MNDLIDHLNVKVIPQIVVLIPCYNEEHTIAKVVQDFEKSVPNAKIYVYDNNSSDRTAIIAREAGAIVRSENLQGKGHVIRRMFSDIDADVYIMVDGDDTYDASAAPALIDLLINDSLDMVNGKRIEQVKEAYRPGHRFGNWMLTTMVTSIFGERTEDMLSGYRAFSRRFVKSFPALSAGFEIETELTVHALELEMPIADVDTHYKDRPDGSESKLSTFKDGLRILKMIAVLIQRERPLKFFGIVGLILGGISLTAVYPVITEYLETGLVPRLPTAILSSALMLLAFLCFFSGVILSTVTNGRKEMKRLTYLQHSSLNPFRKNR
jgi:glycosyltransferase involved in cell wall biosynthesis